MCETNRYVKAIDGAVALCGLSGIWNEGEAKFADIVLPACTNFERWDISEFANCSGYIADSYTQTSHRVISLQKKCIEPLGSPNPTMTSLPIWGRNWGFTKPLRGWDDGVRLGEEILSCDGLAQYITWEEFFKKGYFVVPFPKDYKSTPALRWFAEVGPRTRRTGVLLRTIRLRGQGIADDFRQDRI